MEIADHPIGALDQDLAAACMRALTMSRATCRDFALTHSWESCARQFLGHLAVLRPGQTLKPTQRLATAQG